MIKKAYYFLPLCAAVVLGFPSVANAQFSESAGPGTTQDDPFIVEADENGDFVFTDAGNGFWWDPPFASAFDYEILSPGSLFTMVGLPIGINPDGELFDVIVNGDIVDSVPGGSSYTFAGNGVESFRIGNISNVDVDPSISNPFPTQLFFNNPTGNNFKMSPVIAGTSVPEPSSLATIFIGATLCAVIRRRQS
ncbi:MAG: PEP-CTERM sorting domain-containing protein [Cyanobacteria bacterium J083]|nr:MAG: PEP-CTERM sorting domain-containing protein [Cyanobacteria bacterium J083]